MVRIISDTSTLYSTAQAQEAYYEILPLSPAFITQGGPGCVAMQYVKNKQENQCCLRCFEAALFCSSIFFGES